MRDDDRRVIVTGAASAITCALALALLSARPASGPGPSPAPASARPASTAMPFDPASIGAARTARSALVRSAPTARSNAVSRLRAGILLPVFRTQGAFLRVLTPCEIGGWVAVSDVQLYTKARGAPHRIDQATIVLDPGHGGIEAGATGRDGLSEKVPNVDIARRVASHLRGARVFFTHDSDFLAGLTYRADIANALRADLLVSIHNNASPQGPSSRPGTETYYQLRSAPSKRLAGLMYEELERVLTPYHVAWVGWYGGGAQYRTNAKGTDYYAMLRMTTVPSVIAEGLYVSNPPEEALLRRADIRERIATAIADAIRRLVETTDAGSGYVSPHFRPPGPSGRLPSTCVDPT